MPAPNRLSNDDFITGVTLLYQECRKVNSVTLTMKRYDGRTKPKPRASKLQKTQIKKPEHPAEIQVLFRATNGKKKLTTVVFPKDVNKFQLALGSMIRANIDGLKKHKKGKSKAKSTAAGATTSATKVDQ